MRKTTSLCAIGISASMLSGCTSPFEDQPPAVSDNSLEQVIDTVDYEQALSGLVVQQQYSLETNSGKTVNVYNFTSLPVDPQAFGEMVMYFDRLQSQPETQWRNRSIRIVSEEGQLVETATYENHREAQQHDFLFVPYGTSMPPTFDIDDENGIPQFLAATMVRTEQTVSVVSEPDTSQFPASHTASYGGLETEVCQALVDVQATVQVEAIEPGELHHLAQETVCNGVGRAMVAAQIDMPYDLFKAHQSIEQGVVTIGDKEATILGYAVSQPEYSRLDELL